MPTFCCHNRPDYSKIKEKTVVYRDGLSFVETLTDIIVQLVKTITARYFSATNYWSVSFRWISQNILDKEERSGLCSFSGIWEKKLEMRQRTLIISVSFESIHSPLININSCLLVQKIGYLHKIQWLLEPCILTLQFNTQYVPTSSKPY